MKYIVLIITLFVSMAFPQKSHGQRPQPNADPVMIPIMEANIKAQKEIEGKTVKDLKEIAKHYASATIAMAGIYECKKQDRKMIERFSYQLHAYCNLAGLYARLIMQKTLNVTKLLLERPEAFLQWGPFIYDVVTKTKDHCQQFSAMVMNGQYSFGEVLWLAFPDEMVELFNLMRLADYDWKGLIDTFSEDFDNLSKDVNLKDIGDFLWFILNEGGRTATSSVASAGMDILYDMIGPAGDLFKGDNNNNQSGGDDKKDSKKKILSKIKQIIKAARGVKDLYEVVTNPDMLKSMLLEKLGLSEPLDPEEALNKLFKTENGLNISDYVNDYNTPDSSKYYTQMWYIKKKLNKFEYVYIDDLGEASKDNPKWTRFDVLKSQAFIPPLDELEKVLQNNESQCGWSRNRVESLNTDPDITYKFNADIRSGTITLLEGIFEGILGKPGGVHFHAFAYQISITKYTHKSVTVDSLLLDTSVDDPAVFEAKMKGKLENYIIFDEEGYEYVIEKSSPKYYETADPKKLDISESVTFKAKCSDGGELASGEPWFKVNPSFRYKNLDSEAARNIVIPLAMKTGADPATLDTASVSNAIKAAQDSITYLTAEKERLNAELERISEKINNYNFSLSSTDISELRNQQQSIENQIKSIDNQIVVLRSHIEEYKDNKAEMLEDYYESDSGDRIPSIENRLASMFDLEWVGEGKWNGVTYTREARTRDSEDNYVLTFTAKLEMKRPQKYTIFGIRIHRAQIYIKWVLSGDATNETEVDKLKIPTDWTAEKKEKEVNKRLQELRDTYPDCSISIEYNKVDNIENVDMNSIHLLWPNERLDLARDLVARLINTYARLVELERYIHYTKSLKQMLLQQLKVPMRPPKRGNMADSCFRKWYERAEKNVKSKNNSIL